MLTIKDFKRHDTILLKHKNGSEKTLHVVVLGLNRLYVSGTPKAVFISTIKKLLKDNDICMYINGVQFLEKKQWN